MFVLRRDYQTVCAALPQLVLQLVLLQHYSSSQRKLPISIPKLCLQCTFSCPHALQACSTAGSVESFWASLTEPAAPRTPATSAGLPSGCCAEQLFADLNPLLHSKKGR